MYRYLLKLSFDGTDYHGWQVQPNGITVQEQIQLSMTKLYGYAPDVTGCSRTDSGVHALSFYCHFDLRDNIEVSGIVKGLNSVLPDDIRALECKIVNDDFHCRYNATAKTYVYRIYRDSIDNPFISRYSYKYSGSLDIGKINNFCKSLIGEHDFSGFSSANRSVNNTIRTIYNCHIKEKGNILEFEITGNGFLYNMVRIIVGTAIDVGRGRLEENVAFAVFDTKDRSLGGATAPAKGLFLKDVIY